MRCCQMQKQILNHCLIPRIKVQKFCTFQSVKKPFQILGLQPIAIGSLNKSLLSALWCTQLGIPKIGEFSSKKENVDEDILLLGKGVNAVEIDLMSPLDKSKKPS